MAIAIVAAALVIVAGRSCTQSIIETNKKSRGSESSSAPSYHLITDNEPEHGQFREPPTGEPESVEETTDRQYETVTNMFGEVVETIPITSPEEANMPTTTKSILGAYNDLHTTSPEEAQTTSKYIEIPDEITIHVGW